jgi:hypothetical protein
MRRAGQTRSFLVNVWLLLLSATLVAGLSSGCGARTGLLIPDDRSLPEDDETEVICPKYDINRVRVGEVSRVDLLFVIDNSASMADKQDLLRDAIPPLVQRLANPLCIEAVEPKREQVVATPTAPCPPGFAREFEPINDIHIGIVTSSLGGHGGDICLGRDDQNDSARLVGTLDRGRRLASYQNLGFLAWDPDQALEPPGENDITRLESNFQDMIGAVGEIGCGFEAPLEAFYRFLIDPKPPSSVELRSCGGGSNCTTRVGVDNELLAQRARFLRPDSLLAVVVLSDENDCSIADAGFSWLASTARRGSQAFFLPRATSACDRDPNDPCCQSCAATEASPGCSNPKDDPECRINRGFWDEENDRIGLRCFQQKRRFGSDFMYPTARYAIGLKEFELCPDSIYLDSDCQCRAAKERAKRAGLEAPPCTRKETGAPVANPLFNKVENTSGFSREPSQVFLAAIVGVPWQDIATATSLQTPDKLEYLHTSELSKVDPVLGLSRWDVILGDPLGNVPAADPAMHESVDERSGRNPITLDPMVSSSSTNPKANPINGHERAIPSRDDLQYACIFPLTNPRDCDSSVRACDCGPEETTNPLCQPPNGGLGGPRQFFAKAYPGPRHLDVLKRFGANAILASICPKVVTGEKTDLAFGYRPAVAGIVKRLRCTGLDAEFERDPNSSEFGTVPCHLVAVRRSEPGACSCAEAGRMPVSEELAAEVQRGLELRGACGKNSVPCDQFCTCEVPQTRSEALKACQNDVRESPRDPSGARIDGWCYVDPGAGFGNPALIESCPPANFKNIRLVGSAALREGEELFVACDSKCQKEAP